MDEQCCGQKTYEQLLEGFQSQIDSLRELEAANAALTRQLQEAQGENERLKGLITSSDTVRANACKSVERISAEAAALRKMDSTLLTAWFAYSETEDGTTDDLYEAVMKFHAIASTHTAGAAFLAQMREKEAEASTLKKVLHDIYPTLAGQVIALEKSGETVARDRWAEIARQVYEAEQTADGALLARYEAMKTVVEAAKGVIKSTRVEGAGILPTLIKLEKIIELKTTLAALGGE